MKTRQLFLVPVVCCILLCQYATAQQLSANFSATPTTGCAPLLVRFTDLSTGNATSWKWDLGNGTTSFQRNPSNSYFTPGTYSVRLVIYRGTDSSVIVKPNYITVYATPVVNFGGGPTSGCYPLNVSFTDSSSAVSGTITSWQWDFGDGTVSNLQNPTHTYTASGSYNVTLTITNSNGCVKTLSKPNFVQVAAGVIANFTNTNPPVCTLPVTVNFTSTSTGNVATYLWNFGDGTTSTAANPSHIYTVAGQYSVTLTVTNSTGCSHTITRPSVINAGLVDASFNAPTNICVGTTLGFQNNSTPAGALVSSNWDFGDGTTSASTNPTKTFMTVGTFNIVLTSNFGLCQDTAIRTIVVSPKPTADFTGDNAVSCQTPTVVHFTNASTGGSVLQWLFGDGGTSTDNNPTHTYNSGGNFTVTLIVQNANGCRDTIVKPGFVVIAKPQITGIGPLPVQGCVPYGVNFTPSINTGSPIVSYFWDFGDGSTSTAANPIHTYTVEGTYTVKLRVVSAAGCYDSLILPASVIVGNKPRTNFDATPRLACAQDAIQFTDLTTAPLPDHWFWQFGDGGTSDQQHPIYHYNDTGYFNVTLITTRNGCKDTLKINNFMYIKPPIARFEDSFSCANQNLHYFLDRSKGALTYAWTFGDGNGSTIPSPNHLYADTGRYVVKLRVTNGACAHETTKTILVLHENANYTIADSVACQSKMKIFKSTARPWNIAGYNWTFGDGTTGSSGPTTVHSYPTTGMLYNTQLIITDLNNCPDTSAKPTWVRQQGPKANFGPYQKVCIRSAVNFADSSKGDSLSPIAKWIYDFGDNTGYHTYTAPPFTHVYNVGGTFNVKLIVEDASGCRDSIVKPSIVTINDPKANFQSTDTFTCRRAPVTLTNMSLGNIANWFWDLGDGTTAATPNVTHTYINEGGYNIKLKVVDSLGCVDSIVKPQYVKVFDAHAAFTMSDSFTTCPPLLVTMTNQSVNAIQTTWDFGDNNTSNLYNPSHTYVQGGIFPVKLVIRGNGGCIDSAFKTIKILGPSGSFTYGPATGCSPLQVSFTATAENTYFYTYDYNDGITQTVPSNSSSHTYTILGDYLPKMILEDSLGCRTPIVGPDTIRVKGVRAYIKTLPNYNACDSLTLQFRDSIVTNDVIQSRLWNFGDGFTSTDVNPTHTYRTSGRYYVTLTVTTASGCVGVDTLRTPVRIYSRPAVAILGDTTGCIPKVAQFSGQWNNQDSTAITWLWNFGNGQTSTLRNPPAVTYPTPGLYTIKLINKSAFGCTDSSFTTINVHPLPVINAGPDKFICLGNADTLSVSGGISYQWNAHPSLSCTNCATPTARPDSTRAYIVRGTDVFNCQNLDTVVVRVKQPFLVTMRPGGTICFGQSYQLQASGAERYTWTPSRWLNNANIANPITKPDSTITYTVTGSDTLGCFNNSGSVTVVVHPIPRVDILENQVTVGVGDPVQLHGTNSPDVIRWRWTPNIGLTCPDCQNTIAQPRETTNYTLTVTNAGGCTAQDRVTITLLCKGSNIFIPNTFSPNGDGANDKFYPRGKGVFSVKSMRIFDRWGELLYERTNFAANDPTAGWDGKHNGVALTPDVYVYLMEVICDNNVLYNLKGNVTLLK